MIATVRPCAESYRHEALFYAGPDEFLRETVTFVREAIAASEPILVAVESEKIAAISAELNGDAASVLFADMAAVGANPARIIPAWKDFVAESAGNRRVRGVGEPVSPNRSTDELDECQRHESLLNIAFTGQDFWLLCPYDTERLVAVVLDEARRSHPFVTENGISRASEPFAGLASHAPMFDEPLSDPPPEADWLQFDRHNLGEARILALAFAGRAGLAEDRAEEFVLAINEIATNSLLHGGGLGSLFLWSTPDALVAEIRDRGHITDPLAGRKRPTTEQGGRGLWLANQLCDLVQIRSTATGITVRLHTRRS